jgi:hypothetical protein
MFIIPYYPLISHYIYISSYIPMLNIHYHHIPKCFTIPPASGVLPGHPEGHRSRARRHLPCADRSCAGKVAMFFFWLVKYHKSPKVTPKKIEKSQEKSMITILQICFNDVQWDTHRLKRIFKIATFRFMHIVFFKVSHKNCELALIRGRPGKFRKD